MNGKQIVAAVVGTIFKITVAGVIIMLIYRFSMTAYDFGYRIFADMPFAATPGEEVSVAIVEGKSAMDIGEILKSEGLIADAKLFYAQELLSEYHGKLQPGIYVLNTSMKAKEMMSVMAETETEEQSADDQSTVDDVNTTQTVSEDATTQEETVNQEAEDGSLNYTVDDEQHPDITQEEE